MPDKHEIGLVGANLELGGRIELNRYDHLRIGLLTSFGASLCYVYDEDDWGNPISSTKHMCWDYKELNFLLRVGYEHRF